MKYKDNMHKNNTHLYGHAFFSTFDLNKHNSINICIEIFRKKNMFFRKLEKIGKS